MTKKLKLTLPIFTSREDVQNETDLIRRQVGEVGERLANIRKTEAYKLMGYDSFAEWATTEFPETSGGHLYKLADQAEISQQVGQHVSIPLAQALKSVPADKRQEVLEQAQAIATSESASVTPDVVRTVAAAVKEERAPAPRAAAAPAAIDAELAAAHKRIGDVCGKPVRKALEDGSLDLSRKEVLLWAGMTDEDMEKVYNLVVSNRWGVKKALDFLNKMPGVDTKAIEFINWAIAGGGEWEGTIAGYEFVIKEVRRK